jgi:hypothetical protein
MLNWSPKRQPNFCVVGTACKANKKMKVIKYRLSGIISCFLLLTGCNYSRIWSNELSASSNHGTELASVPNLNNFQSFNGNRITGAQIDESQIKQTIHVDINHSGASDSNSGLQENPFKSLSAALKKAKEYLRQGEDTKIIIHPGVYREGEITINGNKLGSEAKDALLVIEGTTKGRIILSGSEEWQADTWKRVGSYYQHDWPYDFGNDGGPWGKYSPQEVITHRSEMVFVNGQPLKQVLLEKYSYILSDSRYGSGNHQYIGFDAPQNVLESGTFGVAELDKNGNKIYIRPADGVDFANAKIEVATKRFIFQFLQMENVVLRNLNFQHSAGEMVPGGSAVFFGPGEGNKFHNSNILIEDCDFRWNNSQGLRLNHTKNVTLRRNTANYNGFMGINAGLILNTVWEDNETSFNNWRGYMGGWNGYAIAGAKLVWIRDGLFRRYQAIGNMTPGLWFDIDNRNILIEDLTAIDNDGPGLFLEISPGPFVVRKALLADNGINLYINNTKNTFLDSSIIYGVNRGSPIAFNAKKSRSFKDWMGQLLGENDSGQKIPINLGKTDFRNNLIITDNSNGDLIVLKEGKPEIYQAFLEQDYSGSNNIYWSSQEKVFGLGSPWMNYMTDIQGWVEATEEANYRWMNPQFVDPDNYDFRLKESSPLKARESSLPTRRIDSSKVQELRDYRAWIDTLVAKE